jgi:4-amino-4-deoxychorismate lyase
VSANSALIDGKQASAVGYTDRGLQYGDGLFETIHCQQGQPRWLRLHFDRLRRGLTRLQIAFDRFDALQAEIRSLAAGHPRCLVKVIVTRGEASRRGYAPCPDAVPTRIVSCHEWPVEPLTSNEFRVGLSSVRLGINPCLAGLKHLNRLEQVLAQQQMTHNAWNEVLMLSTGGRVISGSMSNVFFVGAQGLFTPRLHECGVEGVMRRVVLEAAAAIGVAVCEREISMAELTQVDEVFLTNVRLGVQSVTWLEGRAVHGRQFAQRLQRQIDATHS